MPTAQDPYGAGMPMPSVLTGEQLYNQIMEAIEPDLLTTAIVGLDEKYKGETAEQKAARLERYRKAYETYDQKFQENHTAWYAEWAQYKKRALKSAEARNATKESQEMQNLEQSMSQA